MMRKKILIVEDDPAVRLALHLRLKQQGYETVFAGDAMASIAEARKHQPDLIILDLGLPAGDGFVVMERLKNITHLAITPVLVISGRDPHLIRDRVLSAGARGFLQKPVDTQELVTTVRTLLEGPAAELAG